MSERTYDVRVVGVDYVCDVCDAGVMQHIGGALMSNPPLFPHKCSNCGATKNFRHTYPTIRYEDTRL